MTLTTEIRINWPVPAVALLDHVSRVAGGDPASVRRRSHEPGEPWWEGSSYHHRDHGLRNQAGQGLLTLASVCWAEQVDEGEPDPDCGEAWRQPPSLVRLSIDNPYGFGHANRGRWVQANQILPAVVDWLDEQGVPRDAWWWEDETAGTYHPGTVPVAYLDTADLRVTWEPEPAATSSNPRAIPP